ncbi:MAG: hypothetical protein VKP62_07505 [Candidatus Sericytochromatia bacterium]|nr:hypothetical protein [Candidatus Sericytochromatia bacterium]
MEGNGFRTLGECEFGTVWFVEGEGKVVVNAYQAALYFSVDDFAHFATMIGEARRRMGPDREPPPPAPPKPPSSKIRQIRPARRDD